MSAAQVEEYRMLYHDYWSRGLQTTTVYSILVIGSAIITAAVFGDGALQTASLAGNLIRVLLPVFAIWFWLTTDKLQKIVMTRQKAVEQALGIPGANFVWNQIRDKLWYQSRVAFWPLVFSLIVVINLITLIPSLLGTILVLTGWGVYIVFLVYYVEKRSES